MIATLSQDIARPPAIVYAILVDQDTWAALDPALLEITPTSLGGRLFVAISGPFIRRDLRARSERLKVLLEATPAS